MKNNINYHHFSQDINLAKLAYVFLFILYFPMVRCISYGEHLFRFLIFFLIHFINHGQLLNSSSSNDFFSPNAFND